MTYRDVSIREARSGRVVRVVLPAILSAALVFPAGTQANEWRQQLGEHTQDNRPPKPPRQTAKQGKKKPARPAEPVKPPPPPLFSRHRRGTYKDRENHLLIDATPQSPPLETDDPGVPDKGEYEINLTSRADFSKESRTFDFLGVDANYGVKPSILGHSVPTQIKLDFPVQGAKSAGEPMIGGIGPTRFGLKFNFHNDENKGMYMSFYPQLEFAMPGTEAVEKGLVEPGQTLILPLLVQKEFKYLTAVANAAWNQPIHDPERDVTGTLSLGVGRALTPHVAAMAEIHSTSTLDFERERLIVVNIGLMRRLRDDATLYAKLGHSLVSDEGPAHTYVGVGVKVTLVPVPKSSAK